METSVIAILHGLVVLYPRDGEYVSAGPAETRRLQDNPRAWLSGHFARNTTIVNLPPARQNQ